MGIEGKKISGKIIGIEAGGEWLKIALIEGAGSAPEISMLSLSRVDDGVDGLGQVFPGAWKSMKAKGKEPVVACLPRQLVTVRMIDLPSTEAAEIDDMVDLQVGKQTPYSKDEIVYDYRLAGTPREGYTTVMLAIAQRSAVRQVFYAFEEAGLEPDRVTVSTEAIAACISAAEEDACSAVLDVDSFFSDFIIMKGGSIQFSRSILIGSDHLADPGSAAKLVKDVQSAIEAFRSEQSGDAVSGITVSGVTEAVKGLVKEFKDSGLNCSVKDFVTRLKRPPRVDAGSLKKMKAVSMSALTGIAVDPNSLEFNLIPDSIGVRRGLVDKAKALTAFGTLVMSLLVCLSLYGSIRGFSVRQNVMQMKEELAEIQPTSERLADMMGVVRQVRARKDPGRSSMGMLLGLRSSLNKISDRIKMSNVDVDVENGTFVFAGIADNTRDIRSFVKALEQDGYFTNVRESNTASKRVGSERKYSFQVSGELESAK